MAIADRLTTEGAIDVVIDEYDLKEGQDVNFFMERLSVDDTLHFCLVMSDASYSKKANDRKKGVGAEAQIISKEIYESVGQTKFIPVVMENDADGKPCLPVFLKSRKYIDFSSPQKINENWDKLVRLLHGKPKRLRPKLGDLPAFLDDEIGFQFTKLRSTYQVLKIALMDGKPGAAVLRDDMLESLRDELKETHESLSTNDRSGDELIAVWKRQLEAQAVARNLLVDWMIVEAKIDADRCLSGCVIPLLECVAHLAIGDSEHVMNTTTKDALKCFAYEMALYAVASLIEADATTALKNLFEHPFPSLRSNLDTRLVGMEGFRHYSKLADAWNSRQDQRWISPLAQLFKNNASHKRIGFPKLVEAEALIFVFNVLNDSAWYPNSAAYLERGPVFPWFLKAKNGKGTDRLAVITGWPTWSEVRNDFIAKFRHQLQGARWEVFEWGSVEYLSAMGFDEDRR